MEESVLRELTLTSLHHCYSSAATMMPVPGRAVQELWACPSTEGTDQSDSAAAANGHQTEIPSSRSPNRFTDSCDPTSDRRRMWIGCDVNPGERKRIKLMKNRESAARSRARKQAYTSELEVEVAHLEEQNAKLRLAIEKLSAAAVGEANQKGNPKLCRTLTAPF